MKKRSFVKDIEAEVTFLRPEDGGRKNSIFYGYRPTFVYDNQAWDAALWFDGSDFNAQGTPVKVYFEFSSPQNHVGKLIPGKVFELHDGRVIARGSVLQVIELEESAKKALSHRGSV
jgi:translation elongation factor EF-Tu-like GTPase